jgi:hypothetical protein
MLWSFGNTDEYGLTHYELRIWRNVVKWDSDSRSVLAWHVLKEAVIT